MVVDALDESSSDVQKLYADLLRQRRIPLGRLCVMITSREPPPDAVKGITCDACDAGPFNLFFRCRDCTEPFDVCYNCKAKQKNCGKPGHTLIEAYEGTEVYKHINPSENVIREYVKNEIHGEIQTYRPGRAELGLYTSQPGTTLLGRLCQKDPKLEETIVEKICARADGKFLLAKLYVETLRVKLKKREIDDALRELPRGYTGVYESAMERIKAYSVNEPRSSATSLAITTLTWVVHTHRPLNLAELQHALAINLDTAFSDDDIYDEEELLTKTAGLLILGDNRDVRVSHYTVQEYFMDQGKEWLLKDADKLIARACLHYLSSDDLSTPCNNSQEDEQFEGRQKRWPFMRYAYEYWGTHAMDASPDPETSADALKFLRDPSRVATLVEASWYLKSAEAAKWEIRKGANALHIAAWFGLTDVLSELVDEGLDINAKDPFHLQTPLIYASRRGHSDTVAKLVELGAAINSRSARGHTALVEAVIEGHLSVVKVLLKRYDLDVNRILPWDFGRSVVMLAVISNNLEIVAALLGRQDISINQGDSKGYTALMLASSFGFVNIVERLLAQPDIDVNVTSRYGTSALFHAAACEDTDIGKDIAELLLDHGINTSVSDRQGGGTALIRAVDCGNRAVVELLLDRNVDIRQTDDQGRGLLHAAAIYDRREVATFVIGRGLPVNVRDKQDRTPLHDASRSGSVAMIELLLERDADALLKDSSGRTPARVAWENGRSIALELLKKKSVQEGDKVGSTMFDEEQLPVWSLAKLGREDIIQRRIAERSRDLFSLSHLDPDTDDTPVHCAVGAEQPSILRLLLSAGLSPDTQNARFRSPLHQAVLSSNIALTQILLEAYPNLNPRDETGTTPLFLAYTSDRLQNALLLVEAGAVIDEKALILPLFFAAIDYERLVAVKVLMKKHKAPILAKNKRGESALQIAKARGLIEIQRLLDGNKSYANNRSLAIDEDEGLDLNASVKGYFTRPEVWKEEEEDEKEKEKEKEEKELRSEDFPAVPTGEVKDDSPSKRREASMAASRR